MDISLIVAFLLGYVLGSVPFGMLLTYAAGGGDIRKFGSGNIGATNVLRSGRKGIAALTLILDLAKGLVAVLLARALFVGPEAGDYWTVGMVAAAGAVVGHCFSLFLKLRGGKGVATYAGVCFGLSWPLGLAYAGIWIVMLLLTRISSLGALSAAVAMPFIALVLGMPMLLTLFLPLSLLVILRHHENIAALFGGKEGRVTDPLDDEELAARQAMTRKGPAPEHEER